MSMKVFPSVIRAVLGRPPTPSFEWTPVNTPLSCFSAATVQSDVRQAAAKRISTSLSTRIILLLPKHILRRDQATTGNQDRGDRNGRARLRKARYNQERGREQRCRVGRRTQHADIAALHPDIPGIECGTDR